MRKWVVIVCVIFFFLIVVFWNRSTAQLSSVSGHSIKIDGSTEDWVGIAPTTPNTSTISKGEYIWKDADDDDTGDGEYAYPTKKIFGSGANLEEFRITWDKENVYFLIKTPRPGEWWVPYRVIAIDEDGAYGGKKGMKVLAQGDMNVIGSNSGTFGELKVASSLACEYVIAVYGTFKGRIWDANGKLLARADGERSDTKGFSIKDQNSSIVEVSVPQKIIGNPSNRTWRFIIALGLEEDGHAREIYEEANEWHGGGGEETNVEDGVDPDFYDLASPDTITQETELGSYNPKAEHGDANGFATIKRSYLSVTFSPKRL